MKHALVTGGSGFIGSHLCDRLLTEGYAVTAVDNFITGRKSNLTNALAHPHFFLLAHDVCKPIPESSLPLLKQFGLSGVFHLACPASPVDFERIPMEILEVDSIGTKHTVDLALRWKARYLVASTSEVYGDPKVHPQPESYWGNVNSVGARACYDEAKRFAEAYVSSATRHKKLNGAIVRIFNTYGPRMRIDDGRLVPELCRRILEKKALQIHGDGSQTRSFCYVSDLVAGIYSLFESNVHEPVNLGNPVEHSILEFAQILQDLLRTDLPVEYLPSRADDPKQRCPDITRAKTLLHWSPKVPLQEGLKLSLSHFEAQL